jgi:hypothetical protein
MNSLALLGLTHIKNMFIYNQIDTLCMENHEEIMSRLKFIGHIEKDEKINVRHVNRQPNNLITKFSRTIIYPDNRSNALKFIKDVVSRSFEIIEHYIYQNNVIITQGIVNDLINARQGLINLKYTYNDDTKFCCDMDVIIETIATKVSSLKNQHPEIFLDEPEKKS